MRTAATACCLALAFACVSRAGDWPGWRGPTGVGHSDEKDLPLTWGGEKNENVLWSVKLDGRGYSSPIVWRQLRFVTGVLADRVTADEPQVPANYVACYEAATGKKLWSAAVPPRLVAEGEARELRRADADDRRRTGLRLVRVVRITPSWSPWTSTARWFGARSFPGPYSLNPAMASSPVLYKDTVIQLCDQGGGKGFLMALDKKTGAVQWRQKRAAESYDRLHAGPHRREGQAAARRQRLERLAGAGPGRRPAGLKLFRG